MTRKLPSDAFEFYLGLGVGRSYRAVAKQFDCSKVAVTNKARKEGWQARLTELERVARIQFEREACSELKTVKERQLKAARALQGKAIEALRDLPPERAIKAASALNIGWKHELALLGESNDRGSRVEEISRREVRELLQVEDESENDNEQATAAV